jgi:hypothetical protein
MSSVRDYGQQVDIQRREFLAVLGSAVVAWPYAIHALEGLE